MGRALKRPGPRRTALGVFLCELRRIARLIGLRALLPPRDRLEQLPPIEGVKLVGVVKLPALM
jgi:hypothetical protein